MNIKQYLDSTYLKTAKQAGVSVQENIEINKRFIQEAIDENFKLIMIRPEMVSLAKDMIEHNQSNVTIGTVIDFPKGQSAVEEKILEAQMAIANGADDLDFVCNYEAFKMGQIELIRDEIYRATKVGLDANKIVKWIIEVAALRPVQIIQLTSLIKQVVIDYFKEDQYEKVFVKSSTGFYQTQDDLPNGATVESIVMMIENGSPLSIKAAGGIRSYEEAIQMINLGVKRIGTSSAKAIIEGQIIQNNY